MTVGQSTGTTDEQGRYDDRTPLQRLTENPEPFLRWAGVAAVLVLLELGAFFGGILTLLDAFVLGVTGVLDALVKLVSPTVGELVFLAQEFLRGFIQGFRATVESWPTLLSRETIPNAGYRTGPNGPWKGTFLGLEPAVAWAIRAVLIVAYSIFSSYWVFRGWLVYRNNYRVADWTPTDDVVDRLRDHRWGQFGIIVLLLFMTMGLFGPALGPTTVDGNIIDPYSNEMKYYDAEAGEVKQTTAGAANFDTKSKGTQETNVGPMTYDSYGRFHPFGTNVNGRDLFTYMMGGARITLIVAGMAIGIAALVAVILSMVSAFYSGTVDLTVLTLADGVISVPQLLLIIMVSTVFANHWLGKALNGGLLLALVFGFTTWPFLWRAVRGPALQVAEEEWIMAAESFGQRPRTIMRKHMLPYILGYLLVYASMSVGGIIITTAALSFLGNGLGVTQPTPAWGRAVSQGQQFVSGPSWHISFIPGVIIVILVTGLNAFGDGIRDAIDPEAFDDEAEEAAAGGGA
jgi:peptide/nickel transport system permease protein